METATVGYGCAETAAGTGDVTSMTYAVGERVRCLVTFPLASAAMVTGNTLPASERNYVSTVIDHEFFFSV